MSARGTTSIPEESNARGHDSQPDPSPIAPPVPSGEHAAPARLRGISPASTSKVSDAKFIADEFDVPERRAAAAVSGPAASEDEVISLAAKVHQKQEKDDPLEGVPTPRRTRRT